MGVIKMILRQAISQMFYHMMTYESTIVIMNKKLYNGRMSCDAEKECKLRP